MQDNHGIESLQSFVSRQPMMESFEKFLTFFKRYSRWQSSDQKNSGFWEKIKERKI